MADNETAAPAPESGTAKSILDSVRGELNKQKREKVKNKLKDLLSKRDEAQKSVSLIDAEIEEVISKFEKGID